MSGAQCSNRDDPKLIDKTFLMRNIRKGDYDHGYIQLLSQLSTIDPDKISRADFEAFIETLRDDFRIIIIENIDTKQIVGTVTCLIESKLLHNFGKVMHIEDVVTDNEVRGRGLGKHLIEHATNIAENCGCYKIILDCEEKNIGFYDKCGFANKNIQMSKYFL